MHLDILSGGAARGLVDALRPEFTAATGCDLHASFSAVGAMHEQLLAGTPCDVIILTAPLIESLARDGRVDAASVAALGAVPTGVAVRKGAALPDVSSGDTLRAALLVSPAIFVPDTERSTAGVHLLRILHRLGIQAELAARLRTYPNGATAMRELAQCSAANAIGITQVSEIISTPGIALVGELPAGFGLAAVYAAAVCVPAREPVLARRFVAMLAGANAAAVRQRAGFGSA
jgi:molybdate transport system substrate-binding protein